uniref:Disease resistance R13L4/SHOC-2-like LRR domain-containing protein n=2 Tax=Guillardia theta TaxID=55529 RepID=A0A6U6BRA6_GUITH|mmetsp:Transcript_40256/g.126753  ORF Transcript_40256/g.126753 Transcript_40256/m.126753 type:complete len:1012 (+) Transcript_40256:189-3224(+)
MSNPSSIARPVQRAWQQDEYMEFCEEAEPILPGAIRVQPLDAPYTCGNFLIPVKALEEAPDGFRRLDWSGRGMNFMPQIPPEYKNAQNVLLNDNKLTAFPQELNQLGILQSLRIDSNSITNVPSYVAHFPMLKHLRAHDNTISSLSSNIGQCKHLLSLDLQRNQLSSIPLSLAACTGLTKLWLSENRIEQIPYTFSHLQNLKSFRIDKNRLKEIEPGITKMKALVQFRASHNQIKEIPVDFGNASQLTELSLNHNSIEALPPSLCKLNLKILRLDQNPLKRPPINVVIRGIQRTYDYLNRLEHALVSWDLDLHRFDMHQVPFPSATSQQTSENWEFDMWCRIRYMVLAENRLQSFPMELGLMTNLTILDVRQNRISAVPPAVGSLRNLQIFDASQNFIQTLPTQMKQNVVLQELLLESNRLSVVPDVVAELQHLKELRLSNNQILTLPDLSNSAGKLEILFLDHNNLRSLAHDLFVLTRLKILKLNNNSLLEIPSDLFKIRGLDHPVNSNPAEEGKMILGSIIDPAIRRNRIHNILNGIRLSSYREISKIPLDQREYSKPQGSGTKKRWDLVRFALFGNDGPRIKSKPRMKGVKPNLPKGKAEKEEGMPETHVQPTKKGFVQRLRELFRSQKTEVLVEEDMNDAEGRMQDDASAGAPSDAASSKDEQNSPRVAEEQKTGPTIFSNLINQFSAVVSRFGTKTQDDDEEENVLSDDYGAYWQEIQEIDLSYNRLENIPAQIANISSLTSLKIHGNNIDQLPRSIGQLEMMKYLNLSSNVFYKVPRELGLLLQMEKLDLCNQGGGELLDDLPIELRKLERLEELRLSRNKFEYLPQCILPALEGSKIKEPGMTSLRILALDNNPLRGLDEDLAFCSKLEKLLLHSTNVKRLNQSISYMYHLQEIWIADTYIRKIDPAIAALPHLKKIILSNEDQIDDFADIRRSMKAEKWSFLSVGEGDVAMIAGMKRIKRMKEKEAAAAVLSNEQSKLKKAQKSGRSLSYDKHAMDSASKTKK